MEELKVFCMNMVRAQGWFNRPRQMRLMMKFWAKRLSSVLVTLSFRCLLVIGECHEGGELQFGVKDIVTADKGPDLGNIGSEQRCVP